MDRASAVRLGSCTSSMMRRFSLGLAKIRKRHFGYLVENIIGVTDPDFSVGERPFGRGIGTEAKFRTEGFDLFDTEAIPVEEVLGIKAKGFDFLMKKYIALGVSCAAVLWAINTEFFAVSHLHMAELAILWTCSRV